MIKIQTNGPGEFSASDEYQAAFGKSPLEAYVKFFTKSEIVQCHPGGVPLYQFRKHLHGIGYSCGPLNCPWEQAGHGWTEIQALFDRVAIDEGKQAQSEYSPEHFYLDIGTWLFQEAVYGTGDVKLCGNKYIGTVCSRNHLPRVVSLPYIYLIDVDRLEDGWWVGGVKLIPVRKMQL